MSAAPGTAAPPLAEGTSKLGALDFALSSLAGGAASTMVALQLLVAPRFVEMFAEFGGRLPAATMLVVRGWPMLAAALLTAALGGAGLWRRSRGAAEAGLALLCLALVVGMGANALCVYGLYAPIFELADSIKP